MPSQKQTKYRAEFWRAWNRTAQMSHKSFLILWLLSTVVFAACYTFLAQIPGEGPTTLSDFPIIPRFFEALYFSIITATSTGYGDIVPQGISKIFASTQSISSIIMIAAFVSKITSRKQEATLDHIHRLSFDATLQSVRHGFFISRKDLDVIIKKTQAGVILTPKDWLNIHAAFRQMQIFMRRIPDFYETRHNVRSLDSDHEQMLFDSVERSLTRVIEVMDALSDAGESIPAHHSCMKELVRLTKLAERTFPLGELDVIDFENCEALKEIVAQVAEIRTRVKV